MLTLPIKKKWFDMICSGEKREEYRKITDYYGTRFRNVWGYAAYWSEPHGDLIDASEKIRVQMYDDEHEDFHTVEMTIDDLLSQSWVKAYAFPVIPASKEG